MIRAMDGKNWKNEVEMEKMQPNIVFIIIDALRARNLSCYGYPMPTSPNIDRLAKEGVLFEKSFSCTNGTDPSLTTIFSGKYPLSHGIVRHGERVENLKNPLANTSLLPEILKQEGYYTMAIDWLSRWHRLGYDYYSGMPQKIDRVSSLKERIKPHIFGHPRIYKFAKSLAQKLPAGKPYEDAAVITERAAHLIRDNRARKFFLFLHYWDTHVPYQPPARYSARFQLEEKDMAHRDVIARYDGSIAYVDHHINMLMKTIEEEGILDNTLIIITADHGESLTDHEIYFAHHGLYDPTIHVPLVFWGPSLLPKGRRVHSLVQHFDIFPTLMDLLGVPERGAGCDGKSLLPLINGEIEQLHEAVYSIDSQGADGKRAIRTNQYKFTTALSEEAAICQVCGCMHGDLEELFNLNEDPGEEMNLLKKRPEIASTLKHALSDWESRVSTEREREIVRSKVKKLLKHKRTSSLEGR